MTGLDALVLAGAAVVAGGLNAVAGGGSFLTFPALLFAGVAPIAANATNTVALWPGSLASVGAYRKDLAHTRRELLVLGAVSLTGGLAGAVLLLQTPEQTFARLVPWLLLGATAIFAGGPALRARLAARGGPEGPRAAGLAAMAPVQFLIAVYGGYFGGGIGILMLAGLAALGMEDIHAMNGLKALLALLINGIAVVAFAVAGVVRWDLAVPMVVGAVVGGYGAARLAKRLDPRWVRGLVVAVGLVLSAVFFLRGGA